MLAGTWQILYLVWKTKGSAVQLLMMTLFCPSASYLFYYYQVNIAILMPQTLRRVSRQERILKEK
jgi:hypothetical protein